MSEEDGLGELPPLLPLGNDAPSDPQPSTSTVGTVVGGMGTAAVEVASALLSTAYTSTVHAASTTAGTAAALSTRAVGTVMALGTKAIAGDAAATAVHLASDAVGTTAGAAVSSSLATTGAVVGAVASVGTSVIARNAAVLLRLGGRAVGAVKPQTPPQGGGMDTPANADQLLMIERGEWVVVDTDDSLCSLDAAAVDARMARLSVSTMQAAVGVSPGLAVPTHPPPRPPPAHPTPVAVDAAPAPPRHAAVAVDGALVHSF